MFQTESLRMIIQIKTSSAFAGTVSPSKLSTFLRWKRYPEQQMFYFLALLKAWSRSPFSTEWNNKSWESLLMYTSGSVWRLHKVRLKVSVDSTLNLVFIDLLVHQHEPTDGILSLCFDEPLSAVPGIVSTRQISSSLIELNWWSNWTWDNRCRVEKETNDCGLYWVKVLGRGTDNLKFLMKTVEHASLLPRLELPRDSLTTMDGVAWVKRF